MAGEISSLFLHSNRGDLVLGQQPVRLQRHGGRHRLGVLLVVTGNRRLVPRVAHLHLRGKQGQGYGETKVKNVLINWSEPVCRNIKCDCDLTIDRYNNILNSLKYCVTINMINIHRMNIKTKVHKKIVHFEV